MNNDINTLISNILQQSVERSVITHDQINNLQQILEESLSNYTVEVIDPTLTEAKDNQNAANLQGFLMSMELRGCTPSSMRAYSYDIKNCLKYINKAVQQITARDLTNYMIYGKTQRKWKDITYNTKRMVLCTFFRWLYEEDIISDDPSKKLKPAKVEKRIGPTVSSYEREEIKTACATERELALVGMLYSTGARISELCQLDIKDIDFSTMSAVVYGKGRKEREIYFTAPDKLHLERYLAERHDDCPALFIAAGKPLRRMTAAGARYALNKIKARDKNIENLTLTPHVFRRSVGTDMIDRGAPLEDVAEKLGHVQLDTTRQCYAKFSRERVHRAHNQYVLS